ncbi:MAG TPA: hypothetical protein VNG31_07305, partial [Candidatus Baltobacteraceae bacterium]|nr:hypothetical protein [Candidatus Baltobacteraceae bacterium]
AYLKAHPDAASIWLNFSYDAADRRDYPRAIADVDAYLTFRPSDASAKQQRAFYVNSLYGGPRYQAYGDVQYEQRFDDVFFELDQTYALAPARRIQPYLALHLTEDTNSGAPGTPQIFSDDVVVAGVGLRSHFGPNVSAFAEGGAGIGLRGQGTTGDVRYGVDYFQSWSRPHGAHTDVGLSAAVYSRYSGNLISYYDVLHDFGGKRLQPIVGINGGLDSRNVFGNSYVEGFAGVQTGTDALSFRLMEVGGTYLTRGVKTSTKLQYTTLRGMLIFGVSK